MPTYGLECVGGDFGVDGVLLELVELVDESLDGLAIGAIFGLVVRQVVGRGQQLALHHRRLVHDLRDLQTSTNIN